MSGPVLVTGATGFVGSHVVDRLLAGGEAVRVTVRRTSNLRWLEGRTVERVEADLRDPAAARAAVAGARAVLHFGGAIKARSAAEFLHHNAEATGALAAAFRDAAPQDGSGLFLYCSTVAAGGPAPREDRSPVPHVREDDPPRPVSPYGVSKLEGERRLSALAGRARVVVIRPPAIYGPRDESILRVFRLLRKGWLFIPVSADRIFSVIHVRDLAEATTLALRDAGARGTYYVSDGAAHTWPEVGAIASEILGVRPRTVRLSLPLTVSAAALSEATARIAGRAPLLSFGKVRELRQRSWVCFPAKAGRDFGFAPRIDIRTGLAETIGWYRQEGWLAG